MQIGLGDGEAAEQQQGKDFRRHVEDDGRVFLIGNANRAGLQMQARMLVARAKRDRAPEVALGAILKAASEFGVGFLEEASQVRDAGHKDAARINHVITEPAAEVSDGSEF